MLGWNHIDAQIAGGGIEHSGRYENGSMQHRVQQAVEVSITRYRLSSISDLT